MPIEGQTDNTGSFSSLADNAGGAEQVNIPINLLGDIKGQLELLNQNFSETFDKMKGSATETNAQLELFQKGVALASKAISFLVDVGGKAIAEATEAVDAEKKLADALKLRGEFTYQAMQRQSEFASSIQRSTKISDDFVTAMQGQLVTLGAHERDLQRGTRAVIGFMQAGVSQQAAIKSVSQLLRGEAAPALQRFGIDTKNAAEALEQGVGLFKLAEDSVDSFTGRLSQLQNAWSDVYEEVGRSIVQSPVIQDILRITTDQVIGLSETIGEKGLVATVDELAVRTSKSAATILYSIAAMIEGWDNLVDGLKGVEKVSAAIAKVFDPLTKPFGDPEKLKQQRNYFDELTEGFIKVGRDGISPTSEKLRQYARELEKVNNLGKQFADSPLLNPVGTNTVLAQPVKLEVPGSGGLSDKDRAKAEKDEAKLEAMERRALEKLEKIGQKRQDFIKKWEQKYTDAKLEARQLDWKNEKEDLERIEDERTALIQEFVQKRIQVNQDASLEELRAMKKHNDAALNQGKFGLEIAQTFAQAGLDTTRNMIDLIVESSQNGADLTASAIANIFASQMISLGWAFQQQAIAYTFAAIADSGASSYKAVAMGVAAKVMLISGYALKAAFGGKGGGAGANLPATGGAVSSGGDGRSGQFNQYIEPRAQSRVPALSRSTERAGSGRGVTDFDRNFFDIGNQGGAVNITNVINLRGFAIGSPAALGRQLSAAYEEANRLSGSGVISNEIAGS